MKKVKKFTENTWEVSVEARPYLRDEENYNAIGSVQFFNTKKEALNHVQTMNEILSKNIERNGDLVKDIAHFPEFGIDAVSDGDLSEHCFQVSFENQEYLEKFRLWLYGERELWNKKQMEDE